MIVKFKKLTPDAVTPTYGHGDSSIDVGIDITTTSVEYDEDQDLYIYHTGLAFEPVEPRVSNFLFLRSSNCKKDCYLTNHVGIADPSYRGEIQFRMKLRDSLENMTLVEMTKMGWTWDFTLSEMKRRARQLEFAPYKSGDKIGQMVFLTYPDVELIEMEELSDSIRSTKGFGSTGK